MASDLPEARHASGHAMARVLATYIDDAERIQTLVHQEFGNGAKLSLTTIEDLRAAHLRKPPEEAPCKLHDGYWPAKASERLASVNRAFVKALETERALSAERAKAQGALDSPALRRPEFVNRAWDRETEQAWRENTELRR